MSKFEKRLILFAIVFVVIYLGAAVITLHNRFAGTETASLRYESEVPTRAEGRLGMAQLLLPMLVMLTLAVTYAAVKKKRDKQMARLEDSEDELPDADWRDAAAPDDRPISDGEANSDPRHSRKNQQRPS